MTSTLNLARVATFAAHRHQPRVLSNAAPSRAVAFENLSRARRLRPTLAPVPSSSAPPPRMRTSRRILAGPGAAPGLGLRAPRTKLRPLAAPPRRQTASTTPPPSTTNCLTDGSISTPPDISSSQSDADAGVIHRRISSTSSTGDGKACDPVTGEVIPCDARDNDPRRTRRSRGGPRRAVGAHLGGAGGEGTVTAPSLIISVGSFSAPVPREGSTYVQIETPPTNADGKETWRVHETRAFVERARIVRLETTSRFAYFVSAFAHLSSSEQDGRALFVVYRK